MRHHEASPTLIIILLCLISSAGRFVIDSYLPSLPDIQYELILDDALTQMTLTIYLLGLGISQLFYGPLADHFGRRKILLLGMAIFFIGNVLCANADSGSTLLWARLIAGVGAGACGVLNRVIASDYFEGPAFAKAWSYTTTALVLTLIFAPLIGGYIQEWRGWSGNFTACSLFIAGVLAITWHFLPETHPHLGEHRIGLKKIFHHYAKALASLSFLLPTFAYMFAFSGLIAYFQISPLLLINQYNWTPVQYGWSSLAIALSYLLGGTIIQRWGHSVGIRPMLQIGLWLGLLGGILLLFIAKLNVNTGWPIVICASIYVLGARLVIPNASALAMGYSVVPKGCAAALVGAIQMLGSMALGALIAQFKTDTAAPLAIFFISVSGLALTFYLLQKIFHST
ncbi:MAG: multidrug effflux MFS transporter [Pseudomonadota bacterium]